MLGLDKTWPLNHEHTIGLLTSKRSTGDEDLQWSISDGVVDVRLHPSLRNYGQFWKLIVIIISVIFLQWCSHW